MSQVGSFNNGSIIPPGTIVETIQGNTGGPVSPDGSNNIHIVGDEVGVTISGNPGTHTLTVSLIGGGDAAQTFVTDSGNADVSGGVINIITDNATLNAGSSVLFSGTSDIVTLNVTDANHNTMIGLSAGNASLTGSNNTALGYNSGSNYSGTESSNILLNSTGIAAESNVLRIGAGTGTGTGEINEAFISGIIGITPSTADGIPVFIGSAGQLGTVGNGGTSLISTLTGDGSVVVHPLAGNINIVGDGSTAAVTANPGTHTLTISAIGGGGGSLNDLVGDDSIPVTPLAGIINVITNNATENCGSSVLFTGSVAHTLALNVTDSNANTMIGLGAGSLTLAGSSNTALGEGSGGALTSGSSNTTIGESSGSSITSGSQNILIGANAGLNYASTESNNIILGSQGIAAESNALRIGSGTGTGANQINKAFVSGIIGITPATADGIPVFVGSAGQLGTVGNGGTSLVSTLTGNTGGAVSPLAGNINIIGDGTTIEITGNPLTNTLTVVGLGGGGGTVAQLSGDTGFALPTAGIINIIAGTSTQNSGSSVSLSGVGDTLTLNVTDTNSNTIIGKSSGKTGITGTNNTVLGVSCGSSLTSGASNIFIGTQAGNLITTGTGNFLCGDGSSNVVLKGSTTSTGLYAFGVGANLFLHNWGATTSGNTFVGIGSGSSFNAGQQAANKNNTGCGKNTLSLITSGSNNTSLGAGSGLGITTGSNNTFIGGSAGGNYNAGESSNICIGYNNFGTTGESNALRIGAGTGTGAGQINKAFVSGVRGITPSGGNGIPVYIDSNGQLGTTPGAGTGIISTLTGNTGGAVGPSGTGNVNIVGDGVSINVTGNPGTNRLTISSIGAGGGPSFFAYRTTDFNFTDATLTTITYDTVASNVGGAFNAGSGVFTAPTTGLYNFSLGALITFALASNFGRGNVVQLVTSRFTFQLFPPTLGITGTGGITQFYVGNNFYVNMNAGETARITVITTAPSIVQNPAAKGITTVSPSTNPGINTFFSGMLV